MSKQEIGFDDIRAGDEIEFGWPEFDTTVTIRGVAARKTNTPTWMSESGRRLVCRVDARDGIILLIDRPKPPLPTTPGTVFRATELYGEPCDVLVFVRQSAASDSVVFYVSAAPVNGFIEHDPIDITAWEPIENGDK